MRIACVGPLKKSGSPKVMCSRAGRDLRGDVGEHDLRLHDAELPVVDRHDRTVPAQMPAAAARLGVADQPPRAVAASAASRTSTAAAAPRDRARGSESAAAARPAEPRRPRRPPTMLALRPVRALRFLPVVAPSAASSSSNSPPRTSSTPSDAQPLGVERRVEAVRADARRRDSARRAVAITGAGQPRRRVHRQVKGDEVGPAQAARAAASPSPRRRTRPSHPPARSHAAGDASPNGCRPSS